MELHKILIYCLVKKCKVVYESFLIYTEPGPELVQALFKLLGHIIVNKAYGEKFGISVYASIVAVCPEITLEVFDDFLMKFIDQSSNFTSAELNTYMIKSFKRLILAAGSIDSSVTWNMSERFIQFLQVDTFDPKESHLFQAGRIYLQKRFGIPFSLTEIDENSAEDVTWREVIGFVNLILERESVKAGVVPSPQIRTDPSDYHL